MHGNKLSPIMFGLLLGTGLGCAVDPISDPGSPKEPSHESIPIPNKVGDSVPDQDPNLPVGIVTEVVPVVIPVAPDVRKEAGVMESPQGPFQWVTITYPSAWACGTYPMGETMVTNPIASADGKGMDAKPDLSIRTCAELAALRRPALKQQARISLENSKTQLLSKNCNARSERRCQDGKGTTVSSSYCYTMYGAMDAGMRVPSTAMGGTSSINSYNTGGTSGSAGATGSSSGATQYSTTNLQVASVDEADYVKNDANTLFILSSDSVRVIDAWPANETHEIARIAIPGEARRLFLEANRLVVYSRLQGKGEGAGSSNPSDQGCTYGYDCRFTSEGGHTMAMVFDVSTPSAPKELARYEMSGGYVASRRVGPHIYTVVHDTGAPQIPGLDFALTATSYQAFMDLYKKRLASNDALIDQTSDDYFLPWIQRSLPNGDKAKVSSCHQALASEGAQGLNYLSLVSFDLTTLTAPVRTVVASKPGYVFASATALYVAVDRMPEMDYSLGYYNSSSRPSDSVVHKFALNGIETRYVGSALLPGHILNQFSMDEYLGILRVASTRGWVPEPTVQSYISTFSEKGGSLVQVGSLGGIAPSEDIRSVRFDGDRGYVVTFKKTDPLFTIDLSEPAAPRVLGELKIPGYSTYMHRLDGNHILAVGFDADDKGSFAYFNGIQIQIFDVTDLSNPKLQWKKVIGTRGSNSEALTNHLAFNYFAPKKMLLLPLTICEGGGNGMAGYNMSFAGLMAFDISLENGITEHGRLPFTDASDTIATGTCNQWWTNSKSLVKRSIFMDDWVYGLSNEQLRVAAIDAMSTPLQTLSLK